MHWVLLLWSGSHVGKSTGIDFAFWVLLTHTDSLSGFVGQWLGCLFHVHGLRLSFTVLGVSCIVSAIHYLVGFLRAGPAASNSCRVLFASYRHDRGPSSVA